MTQNAEIIGAAVGPVLCSEPGCGEAATHTYTWEWGATGTCCARHQQLHQQTATQLERSIQFGPLPNLPAAPLSRDERAQLAGRAYALGMEIEDLQRDKAGLLADNVKLAGQVQTLTVQNREYEQQARDAAFQRDQALDARDAAQLDLAQHMDELDRLRLIVRNQQEPESFGGTTSSPLPPTTPDP